MMLVLMFLGAKKKTTYAKLRQKYFKNVGANIKVISKPIIMPTNNVIVPLMSILSFILYINGSPIWSANKILL